MKSKAQQIKNIKWWVAKRVTFKGLNHTYDTALAYYLRFSPSMFVGLTDEDIKQLTKELYDE